MLGYRFVLHIRDLVSKRLYMFNPAGTSKDLRKLVSNKIKPSQNDLAIALCIGRQGEISDLTAEGQHYRIAGLNLLTAITI